MPESADNQPLLIVSGADGSRHRRGCEEGKRDTPLSFPLVGQSDIPLGADANLHCAHGDVVKVGDSRLEEVALTTANTGALTSHCKSTFAATIVTRRAETNRLGRAYQRDRAWPGDAPGSPKNNSKRVFGVRIHGSTARFDTHHGSEIR